jgi:hypothetical protein
VLATLVEHLRDGEDAVGAATRPAEATLRLVVERLDDGVKMDAVTTAVSEVERATKETVPEMETV